MMKTVKHLLCCAIAASALISTGVHAASWKDALSSAASELGNQNSTTQEGGWSLASLTNLLREGANKRGNSSRLTQSFHFFMFEPIFSPVNALNQPI